MEEAIKWVIVNILAFVIRTVTIHPNFLVYYILLSWDCQLKTMGYQHYPNLSERANFGESNCYAYSFKADFVAFQVGQICLNSWDCFRTLQYWSQVRCQVALNSKISYLDQADWTIDLSIGFTITIKDEVVAIL